MIWLEILVCLIFGIICFLYLLHVIPPSFEFYFIILTTWALQVQFLLQIIVNRCSILVTDSKKALRLKVGVAVLITLVNISVYNIWIPARLQISERYIWINEWWDRCEKGIYLIVDACLNFYFIHIVKENLVMHGLTKYRTLMHFNMFIVGFSLSMDVLIIAMMSLPNTFVYMQFHPLAYIVKLNIEMSMADLIGKIARNRNCGVISEGDFSNSVSGPTTGSSGSRNRDSRCIDHDVVRARRPHYVTFELRNIGTGADAGTFVGTGSILERSRFTGDTDGPVRPDPAKRHSILGGVDTRESTQQFGSYGIGIKKKDAPSRPPPPPPPSPPPPPPPASTKPKSVLSSRHPSVLSTRQPSTSTKPNSALSPKPSLIHSPKPPSVASGRRFGEEGSTWYEDEHRSGSRTSSSQEGFLVSPRIYEEEMRRRPAPVPETRAMGGGSRDRSRSSDRSNWV
ncbi:hypothetical protein F5X68DRAFT_164047 [Plectosphaerella plurivora]|uniref:Uncharacterized protein n=1 Tax=Plectosphaerella plurivora TaxID=936078 RepID=A0A9P8VMI6_9PEZI|nr:hypothetical protein F5X68DRAFT_164047 [Plectosphaerella plurivora]